MNCNAVGWLAMVACAGIVVQQPSFVRNAVADSVYSNAVVAADHPAASEAGLEILRSGGNVVDAAVATSFALSVVRPASCGIGGGGFMVIWLADQQKAIAVDYRERAPAKAHRDMFVGAHNAAGDASRAGPLAVAVPGTVAGLCDIAEKYGSLPLSELLQPAIRLARNGVPLNAAERNFQVAALGDLKKHAGYLERFATLKRLYLNDGVVWPEDAVFRSPQLRVLELIAKHGRDGFYRGEVAESLVAEIRRGGGVMTPDDLANYEPTMREPLRSQFRGHEVITMPPPSSGGIAIIEILRVLEALTERDLRFAAALRQHNGPEYVHLVTEAMKHAFADRAEFLGDADFTTVPVDQLTSEQHAKALAGRIDLNQTKPLETYGRFLPSKDAGTSHFCIIDKHGNAVSCTETINTSFGSYVVDPRFGVVLNNEMDDFSAVPGQPNAFGLIQSDANAVEPGKRPLSSMSPTIVIRDGQARFVAGASGGPRIITATLQVLLNEILFGMTPEAAVEQARFHHQWLPDVLYAEPRVFNSVHEKLMEKSHTLKRASSLGASQSASRSPDGLRGASDSRKSGRAAGF